MTARDIGKIKKDGELRAVSTALKDKCYRMETHARQTRQDDFAAFAQQLDLLELEIADAKDLFQERKQLLADGAEEDAG